MFNQYLGSPRTAIAANNNQQPAQEQALSILSPRNFLKLISNSIDQFRKHTNSSPNQNNYQQFISTFEPYLNLIKEEYEKYKMKMIKIQSKNKNEELQIELKLNKIPSKYFVDCREFTLEIGKRNQGVKKQEELTEYLDQIQVVLFIKAGKYPEKSYIILENMKHLEHLINQQIIKVTFFRKILKEKIILKSEKQIKIKKTQEKISRLKHTLQYISVMKKMRDLKFCSSSAQNEKQKLNKEFLLKFKKSELDLCNKFHCLQKQHCNIDGYRSQIKEKLYKEFMDEISNIFNKLLNYNTEQWKNINIPTSIFANQADNNLSYNNITVLDQSYFAFDTNTVTINPNNKNNYLKESIKQEDQEQNTESLSLNKLSKQWLIIQQFDMYDEKQVNFYLFNLLVLHNDRFSRDMRNYVAYLYNNMMKEKQQESIFKNGQSLAALRNKNIVKQEEIGGNEQNDERLAEIDMKLYVKIVKFYFQLLKKIYLLIKNQQQLQFLQRFKLKYGAFIQQRITYFIELKEITHEWKNDDFYNYLEIINYWQHQQFYEIEDFCINLRDEKIQEYLTLIQKNLLIKQIKQSIETSTYLPVNLGSNNYMPIHYVLNNKNPLYQEEMNATLNNIELTNNNSRQTQFQSDVLRLINKNIFYKNKIYKICDSFLELIKHIEKYVQLKQNLNSFQQNIQEKLCQVIGFYAWYNQKNMLTNKNGTKTLKNYCTFYSTLLFLIEIVDSLSIVNKKIQKTRVQITECEAQISKTIMMTPFMMIQERISKVYQSKISTRLQVPTPETQRIIDILKISIDCFKEYFPLQNQAKLQDSFMIKFTKTSIKLIMKNYFGYLVNMQKRGITQIRWFLPKLKQILQITLITNDKIVDRKGALLCKNGNTFCLFNEQMEQMQRMLKHKSSGIK